MLKILYAALEGLGSAIPIGLGGLVWIGYKIGPEMIAPLALAMFCALAVTNLAAMFSQRPLIYTTRFFEVALLVGFIDSFVPQLGGWGLADTPAVRLTLVVMACIVAALLQPVFYGLRLQRMTRFIPIPVFTGFLNAVALLLLISQVKQVLGLHHHQPLFLMPSLVIAGVCFGLAYATKLANPKLPAGMVGLVAAGLTAYALGLMGHETPSIMPAKLQWVLPVALLDWGVFDVSKVALVPLLLNTVVAGGLLATVVFLNTITTGEVISQVDGKPSPSLAQSLLLSAGKIISAVLGSLPMSGSPTPTLASLRTGELTRPALLLLALLAPLIYALGLLSHQPQAAMIGLLPFLALGIFDRGSTLAAWRYLAHPGVRRAMSPMQREDLLIVALVTLLGVLVNMVVALLVGMMLGLVLFARRNGKSPIRDIHDGRTWRSQCARSQADARLLERKGSAILCVRLQGALYYGVAQLLREELHAMLPDTRWLVVDWHAVVSQDTTLLHMFEGFEKTAAKRGTQLVHCARAGDETAHTDLDRALEHCENQLLASERGTVQTLPANALRESELLAGLDAVAQERVHDCFETRAHIQGDYLMKKGDHARELHLIVSGSADVLIEGGAIRLAGVSAGAIVGEMCFLDGTPRAADVQATAPLVSLVLSRERFDALSQHHPEITQRMLQNLCTELASRLRALHGLIAHERL